MKTEEQLTKLKDNIYDVKEYPTNKTTEAYLDGFFDALCHALGE